MGGVEEARPREGPRAGTGLRLVIFYSHQDEALRDELETHLKLLRREGLIQLWHDRKIVAGGLWMNRIDENSRQADLILLLVSADFVASDYFYDVMAVDPNATVIPVIVRACAWESAPLLGELEPLPRDGKAVTSWGNRDEAWKDVEDGIRRVVTARRG